MRFVDHVFDNFSNGEDHLPEGAKNIQVDSLYVISRVPDELHYTYLDTFGHPVIHT
jgi:oligosaccharyltransferase complex subunit alpha (ribophorin I)